MGTDERLSSEDRDQLRSALQGAKLRPNGFYKARCPLCLMRVGREDRSGALGMSSETGHVRCFRCNARTRFSDLATPGLAPPRAPRWSDPAAKGIPKPDGFCPLYEEPWRSSVLGALPRRYLASRGVTQDVIDEARIGFCTEGRFRGRVVVPGLDARGVWRWFSARDYTGELSRKYDYPGGDRGGLLYNEGALFASTDEPILLVEGVFDVLALGLERSAAFWGEPTELHLESLLESRRPLVVVQDGDAWKQAQALAWRLRFEGKQAGFVKLPPKTDPDQVDRAWLLDAAWESLG